ncbi:MAG TPA: ATP-grasp fold amidoligase family protein [Atribacterota bacterium]|nr:ATP-grasp fold amidoligase family protein [Atribacterota bacterium]
MLNSKKIREKIIDSQYLFIIFTNLRAYIVYYLNRISNNELEKRRFYKVLKYNVNLANPQSFNEKIFWKKIYDRNPLLPITADKYAVRAHIKKVLGEETANDILIPLLYITDKPEAIPFENLQIPYIIKPNHTSGRYIIIRNNDYNKRKIIITCKKWLKTPFGLEKLEWAYQSIKRKIVIEKLLLDEEGNIPADFKFDMFDSRCKRIRVVRNRGSNQSNLIYDSKWNLLLKIKGEQSPKFGIEKPKNFEIMIEIAEKLAADFDHVRVDLYNINGKIYFGELTHYSQSGLINRISRNSDLELGKAWTIKPEYWKIDKT